MRKAQDGDRRAYELLLTEVANLVRDFVRKRVRAHGGHERDWCEEIVQETLLSIHRDRHTYDPARPFGPWMYAIARHRISDHVTRHRRRGETELLADHALDEVAAHEVDGGDRPVSRFLRRALGQLSTRQREIIEMMKLDGFSVAEVSEKTGLTASTVKVTAHRGYKRLRALLGDAS